MCAGHEAAMLASRHDAAGQVEPHHHVPDTTSICLSLTSLFVLLMLECCALLTLDTATPEVPQPTSYRLTFCQTLCWCQNSSLHSEETGAPALWSSGTTT